MTYTTPRTWAAGERPTAAQFNQDIRDNVSFLANPPACRVRNSGALSHTSSGNWQALSGLDSERYDTDSMHSTVSNTGRITINTAGVYVVTGNIEFVANATGLRGLKVYLNGTTDIVTDHENSSGGTFGTALTVATIYKFAAADFIELYAFQNSGGNLGITAAANYTPEFAATWVGRG